MRNSNKYVSTTLGNIFTVLGSIYRKMAEISSHNCFGMRNSNKYVSNILDNIFKVGGQITGKCLK